MVSFNYKNAFIWFELLDSSAVLVKAALCISKEKDFYLSVREKKVYKQPYRSLLMKEWL